MSCPACEYDGAGFPCCTVVCRRAECYPCWRDELTGRDPVYAAQLDYFDAVEYADRAEEEGWDGWRTARNHAESALARWRHLRELEAGQGPEGPAQPAWP